MKALFSGFLGPPNDSESGPRDQEEWDEQEREREREREREMRGSPLSRRELSD
jgi:hypothetical protein